LDGRAIVREYGVIMGMTGRNLALKAGEYEISPSSDSRCGKSEGKRNFV